MIRFLSLPKKVHTIQRSVIPPITSAVKKNLLILGGRRGKHTSTSVETGIVSLQLDYYMSSQFAGIAIAMTQNMYAQLDLQVNILPTCPPGMELHRVRQHANASDNKTTVVGCVEQNIMIPTLYNDKDNYLQVQAMAAMFRQSPLCLVSLDDHGDDPSGRKKRIGAHEDTVSLLQRILLPQDEYDVMASPRSTKLTDLQNGTYDMIQAYTTTEVPTLQRTFGDSVKVQFLEESLLGSGSLGYSQVLFAPQEQLTNNNNNEKHSDVIQRFLQATFDGWKVAIQDPTLAAHSVLDLQRTLGGDEENKNDHWDTKNQLEYTIQSIEQCCHHVHETFQGDKYGVISPKRWNQATQWLLSSSSSEKQEVVNENFGLFNKDDIWQPSSQLLAGNELARTVLEQVKQDAKTFQQYGNRQPSLAVITVGTSALSRYQDSKKRLQLFSNANHSWFDKTQVGKAHGIHVQEYYLSEDSTEDDVLSLLYKLRDDDEVDGIQLMWPLPSHMDNDISEIYQSIPLQCDVDGAHYVREMELGNNTALPPVTPKAVVELLKHYKIEIENQHVVIIGRSRILGSPLSYMLRDEYNANVTTVHSKTSPDKLQDLVKCADIVVSCAGEPNLLHAEWISPSTTVICVGTTFDPSTSTLKSDFANLQDLHKYANKFSPVPGGIGPMSIAYLFQNVVTAAQNKLKSTTTKHWKKTSGYLERTLFFHSYTQALEFMDQVNDMSTKMDHHANIQITHKCINGVHLNLQFFTYEANEITDKDYKAAQMLDDLYDAFSS